MVYYASFLQTTILRQVNTSQNHQAHESLAMLASSLSQIRLQRQFKTVAREFNTGQQHQACESLLRLAFTLSQIRAQRRFKTIVLLGTSKRRKGASKEEMEPAVGEAA